RQRYAAGRTRAVGSGAGPAQGVDGQGELSAAVATDLYTDHVNVGDGGNDPGHREPVRVGRERDSLRYVLRLIQRLREHPHPAAALTVRPDVERDCVARPEVRARAA